MRTLLHILAYTLLFAVAFNGFTYAARARSMRRARACELPERLAPAAACWSFVGECFALVLVLLLIPIGWLSPRRRRGSGDKGPVVLVHGWGLNRGCFLLLTHRLLRDGWGPISALDYWSLAGNPQRAARRLHQLVERERAEASKPVTLIGHSLGGVVIRVYARSAPEGAVRRIVTLGSPHQGTELARLGGLHRLAPGSPLLSELAKADREHPRFDVITISSTFDALILPVGNAIHPGAFNVQLNDVGHNALLFSSKVYQLIRENLEAA